MSIELKGLEEVLDGLDIFTDIDRVERGLKKACAIVERAAKQKAQVGRGTGELARSITSDVKDLVGEVYTPLEYAPYVEFGTGLFAEEKGRQDVPWSYKDDKGEWHTTSGREPAPFIRPALYENKEKILEILKGSMVNND